MLLPPIPNLSKTATLIWGWADGFVNLLSCTVLWQQLDCALDDFLLDNDLPVVTPWSPSCRLWRRRNMHRVRLWVRRRNRHRVCRNSWPREALWVQRWLQQRYVMPRPPSKTALLLPLPSSLCVFRDLFRDGNWVVGCYLYCLIFLHALWLDMMLANTLEIML